MTMMTSDDPERSISRGVDKSDRSSATTGVISGGGSEKGNERDFSGTSGGSSVLNQSTCTSIEAIARASSGSHPSEKKKRKEKEPADGKKYICQAEGCVYRTKYTFGLKRHMETRHAKEGEIVWHKCKHEGCTYQSRQRSNLGRHIREHHEREKRKDYKCKIEGCNSIFNRSDHLSRHMKTVHFSTDRTRAYRPHKHNKPMQQNGKDGDKEADRETQNTNTTTSTNTTRFNRNLSKEKEKVMTDTILAEKKIEILSGQDSQDQDRDLLLSTIPSTVNATANTTATSPTSQSENAPKTEPDADVDVNINVEKIKSINNKSHQNNNEDLLSFASEINGSEHLLSYPKIEIVTKFRLQEEELYQKEQHEDLQQQQQQQRHHHHHQQQQQQTQEKINRVHPHQKQQEVKHRNHFSSPYYVDNSNNSNSNDGIGTNNSSCYNQMQQQQQQRQHQYSQSVYSANPSYSTSTNAPSTEQQQRYSLYDRYKDIHINLEASRRGRNNGQTHYYSVHSPSLGPSNENETGTRTGTGSGRVPPLLLPASLASQQTQQQYQYIPTSTSNHASSQLQQQQINLSPLRQNLNQPIQCQSQPSQQYQPNQPPPKQAMIFEQIRPNPDVSVIYSSVSSTQQAGRSQSDPASGVTAGITGVKRLASMTPEDLHLSQSSGPSQPQPALPQNSNSQYHVMQEQHHITNTQPSSPLIASISSSSNKSQRIHTSHNNNGNYGATVPVPGRRTSSSLAVSAYPSPSHNDYSNITGSSGLSSSTGPGPEAGDSSHTVDQQLYHQQQQRQLYLQDVDSQVSHHPKHAQQQTYHKQLSDQQQYQQQQHQQQLHRQQQQQQQQQQHHHQSQGSQGQGNSRNINQPP
jgi:hypothetical protein